MTTLDTRMSKPRFSAHSEPASTGGRNSNSGVPSPGMYSARCRRSSVVRGAIFTFTPKRWASSTSSRSSRSLKPPSVTISSWTSCSLRMRGTASRPPSTGRSAASPPGETAPRNSYWMPLRPDPSERRNFASWLPSPTRTVRRRARFLILDLALNVFFGEHTLLDKQIADRVNPFRVMAQLMFRMFVAMRIGRCIAHLYLLVTGPI